MLESREGQTVPDVTFPIRIDNAWQKISSDAVFKGKTVVLFALPGAFTPTCSSRHLPRYNELAGVLKANGVDSVVCLAVNDPFVMETQSPGPQPGRSSPLLPQSVRPNDADFLLAQLILINLPQRVLVPISV